MDSSILCSLGSCEDQWMRFNWVIWILYYFILDSKKRLCYYSSCKTFYCMLWHCTYHCPSNSKVQLLHGLEPRVIWLWFFFGCYVISHIFHQLIRWVFSPPNAILNLLGWIQCDTITQIPHVCSDNYNPTKQDLYSWCETMCFQCILFIQKKVHCFAKTNKNDHRNLE